MTNLWGRMICRCVYFFLSPLWDEIVWEEREGLTYPTQVLHYEGYGASLIKRFKASPDAWAQLIKQLAFARMNGRPPVVYESAQTRKFQLGRTEVIRSTSNEGVEWVRSMDDLKATVRFYDLLLLVSALLDDRK